MGFTKKLGQDFILEGNQIKLTPSYLSTNKNKFKKITGSRFASILGFNDFTSPAKVWSMMTNIYAESMDEMLANVGNVIEPKIHKYVCEEIGVKYIQYDPFKIKWDVFKEDKIFGGIPDGEPVNNIGEFLYPDYPMLEIKTTSIDSFVYKKQNNQFILQKEIDGSPKVKLKNGKYDKWFDMNKKVIIPREYMFQLGLYCYLRNINDGIFAICFLETSDYLRPENCNVNEREIKLVKFKIDKEEFKQFVKYGRDWYQNYIEKGISPELTPSDIEWFNSEDK